MRGNVARDSAAGVNVVRQFDRGPECSLISVLRRPLADGAAPDGHKDKGAQRLVQMGIAQVQAQVAGRKAQEAADEAAKMQKAKGDWKAELDNLKGQLQAASVAATSEESEVTKQLSAAQSALDKLEQQRADEHTQALLDNVQQLSQAEQRADEAEQQVSSLEQQLEQKSSQVQQLESEHVDAGERCDRKCMQNQVLHKIMELADAEQRAKRDEEADENIARMKMMNLQLSELEKQLQDKDHTLGEITADRDKLGFLFEIQTGESWKASLGDYFKVCFSNLPADCT